MSQIVFTVDNTGNNIKTPTITTNEILELTGGSGVISENVKFLNGDVIFNQSGNAVTLTSAATAPRTLTLPDASGTLVTSDIVTSPGLYIPMTYDQNNASSSTEYVALGRFIYPGSTAWQLSGVKVLTRMDFGITSYDVKLQDITNNNTIAVVTGLTFTADGITDMGTLSNVPSTQATLEVQLKCTGGNGTQYAYLTAAQFYNSGGIYLNVSDFTSQLQAFDINSLSRTGTWTAQRGSANNWFIRKSAAAETIYISADLNLNFCTNSNKGAKILSYKVVYAVGTQALTGTPTDTLVTKDYTTGSPVVTSFGGSITGTYQTAIGNYIIARTLGTPVYMNSSNTTVNLEIAFATDTTTILDVYEIFVLYTLAL